MPRFCIMFMLITPMSLDKWEKTKLSEEEPRLDEELMEIHRALHAKPSHPRYSTIPVVDALLRLRKYVESGLNLGVYAFTHGDRAAARHVVGLEQAVSDVIYQIIIHTSLSIGHRVEAAVGAMPIYLYASAIDKVVDAVKDLVYLTLMRRHTPPRVGAWLTKVSDKAVAKVPGSAVFEKSVEWVTEEYAVDVLAIMRGDGSWVIAPEDDVVIDDSDVIYVFGHKENVDEMLQRLGVGELTEEEPPPPVRPILEKLDSMIDLVYLLNYLALYQLRAQDPKLAEEILEMEYTLDIMRLSLMDSVTDLEGVEPRCRTALLNLVTRLEDIADAVTSSIAAPAGEEYRDILREVVEEAEEQLWEFIAVKDFAIRDLAEKLEDVGAEVLAIKKGREWIAVTPFNFGRITVSKGDKVLLLFQEALEDDVAEELKEWLVPPKEWWEED